VPSATEHTEVLCYPERRLHCGRRRAAGPVQVVLHYRRSSGGNATGLEPVQETRLHRAALEIFGRLAGVHQHLRPRFGEGTAEWLPPDRDLQQAVGEFGTVRV